MPTPQDYRDLLYVWDTGFYRTDVASLRKQLHDVQLVLGSVEDTVPAFAERWFSANRVCCVRLRLL